MDQARAAILLLSQITVNEVGNLASIERIAYPRLDFKNVLLQKNFLIFTPLHLKKINLRIKLLGADYCEQLLSWDEHKPMVAEYCKELILSPLSRQCKKPIESMGCYTILGGDFSWQKKDKNFEHNQRNLRLKQYLSM